MTAPKLRVFEGPEKAENVSPATGCELQSVAVSIGDVVPLLLDAALTNRTWLQDFSDETLEISQDLYEILLAYRQVAEISVRAA